VTTKQTLFRILGGLMVALIAVCVVIVVLTVATVGKWLSNT
jgi:uncharacterized membrane protein